MTTHELIEHTVLYALGLLDDTETAEYEAALTAAAPHVRAMVKAEAERMADLGDLLPDERPGPELRDMVVAAVRAGMREQEVERRIAAARTATPAAAAPAPAVVGRITPERRHAQPALSRSARVHWLWRAAAIGLAGATIALTVISSDVRNLRDSAAEGARLAHVYDRAGAEFFDDLMFDETTRRVVLTPASADTTAAASVWHNPDWPASRLVVKNLRPQDNNQPYRLVVLDADGNVAREVAEIRPTGELEEISISVNLSTESRFAIYRGVEDALNAQPVLRSSGL